MSEVILDAKTEHKKRTLACYILTFNFMYDFVCRH